MRIEHVDEEEWERALPKRGFEPFHTPEALSVLDRHTSGELHRLVGYKGDQPIGIFPVIVQQRLVGKVVLSPPPSMGVPRLGPLLMPASPKQRKQEKLNQRFTEQVLERLGVDDSRTLTRFICPPTYDDPRPYTWEGMGIETAFTYSVETSDGDAEELLGSFSKSLRREIRDGQELDVAVSVEGPEAARPVHEQTRKRYEEQDRAYSLEWEYVDDLTQTLAKTNRCRVYTARTPDGTFLSGITVLYSNDAAYFWQGGTRATYEGVSINSLVHWKILEDIIENPPYESIERYDLMGANTERLCQYKSKFGATLVPYYVVESSGSQMELAKKTYQLLSN